MNNVCRHPLGRGISIMYNTNLPNKSISNLKLKINPEYAKLDSKKPLKDLVNVIVSNLIKKVRY
jgi:hypothetical protein